MNQYDPQEQQPTDDCWISDLLDAATILSVSASQEERAVILDTCIASVVLKGAAAKVECQNSDFGSGLHTQTFKVAAE